MFGIGLGLAFTYYRDLVAMANDLRRISALQTEFGVFTSLRTLDRPQCHACWSVVKEGLVGLEERLHGGDEVRAKNCNTGRVSKRSSARLYRLRGWSCSMLVLVGY